MSDATETAEPPANFKTRLRRIQDALFGRNVRGRLPQTPLMIVLACVIGVLGGYGSVLFTWLIHAVTRISVEPVLAYANGSFWRYSLLIPVPALGLLLVGWLTRTYAPEAQGHGVPEVIFAVARRDGVIRPRVSIVKVLASGVCIGTGGSIGREGPIVQIGAALGSAAGQYLKLSSRNIKVLVACGAAAGISATFNAPLAGVIFASEIILGNFAVQSLTPVVIASVLADVVQFYLGEHGMEPAFRQLRYEYRGTIEQLPFYFALGCICGLMAVSFTKGLYRIEDITARLLPKWWARALVCGALVGLAGAFYPAQPPQRSAATEQEATESGLVVPPLFGVGYNVVDHALHLENLETPTDSPAPAKGGDRRVQLTGEQLLQQLWWLLPLIFLKPLLTSITLAGGGSGGIFAPSLFIGSTLGACFGLLVNYVSPEVAANPGVYAVVGMGAVVAGTTHGPLSAILIVYEMTGDYHIILPIMIAAGLASVVASVIDPDSIYHKKLTRRGHHLARSHFLAELEDIMVRDLMIRKFPVVQASDTLTEIVRIARENPQFESLPVMDADGQLRGIIRPEDLHRVLDSDVVPHLVRAGDIALHAAVSVSPDENLLEALRDFGTRDVETLPVEEGEGKQRRLVGMLLRNDVMYRYREELLNRGLEP